MAGSKQVQFEVQFYVQLIIPRTVGMAHPLYFLLCTCLNPLLLPHPPFGFPKFTHVSGTQVIAEPFLSFRLST
jgi:hypothetical protein